MLVAYLLWLFPGMAGVHGFYLERVKSGITQLLLFILSWATVIIVIVYVLTITLQFGG
jgi:TM2 domain-containing membrane protein YozV